jgi:CheY-like chemotaxis protein
MYIWWPILIKMLILCVDDDPDDLDLLREAIHEVSPASQCIFANSAQEALQLLENDLIVLPNLIFLDINMPVMNGRELFLILRRNKSFDAIRVVIYSTSSQRKDIDEFESMGAKFLVKPPKFSVLVDAVRDILTRY